MNAKGLGSCWALKRRKRRTAREKIAGAMKWALQVGCFNIAAELNEALALLPCESEEAPPKRWRRA
jgi:hypothetical protein